MITIIAISALIGLTFAPIGCLVLWKDYIYLGDGLSHTSMLAAVISVLYGFSIIYTGIVNTIIFAVIIFKLRSQSGNNAAIGLTSSIMVSLALILSYIYPNSFNLNSLLFGDIVTTNLTDILVLGALFLLVVLFFTIFYHQIILTILNKDLASSRGVNVNIIEFIFLCLLSFSVLVTIKIVGALLITSIILIPAMCAKIVANSPLKMIIIAMIIAQIMSLFGVIVSFYTDLPFAPMITLCGGIIFVLMLIHNHFKQRGLYSFLS